MTANLASRPLARLPPEVNRTLYVRNLPFNVSSEDMHEIFGKYGALQQIRLGTTKATKGTPTSSTRTSTTPSRRASTSADSTSRTAT